MNIEQRLQRVLQILEGADHKGVLSDIERDIVLGELREAYAELKFGKTENEEQPQTAPTTPIAPVTPTEKVETEEEPEVEVELIFDEESEETENGEWEAEKEEQPEIAPTTPIVEEKFSTLNSQLSTPKRSALLSLYEDAPTPVVGEQFHEQPSVADTIACPKGVAESAPVALLRDAIGVADKFMLIRELFDGDADAYEKAIDALEAQPSFDDCVIFITEHYTWSPNSQATKLIMDLLQRKYN